MRLRTQRTRRTTYKGGVIMENREIILSVRDLNVKFSLRGKNGARGAFPAFRNGNDND